MPKPIRPKDVARLYMHRFKYYYPNVTMYQNDLRNMPQSNDKIALNLLSCLTTSQMRAYDLTAVHILPDRSFTYRRIPDLLTELNQQPDWEHKTIMACPRFGMPESIVGVYCFDNFVIDNRIAEGGNVLWAPHQFTPRWTVLTDLAAIGPESQEDG